MKKALFIVFSCCILHTVYASTDPHLSQFYASPLYLAPSFSGSTGGTRIALNFRDQWPKIPGAFITYALSADHYIPQYKSGVGLIIMRDQAGGSKLNTTDIAAQYAANIKINNFWSFRPGIEFTYFQRTIDYANLIFQDQLSIEGLRPNPEYISDDENGKGNYDFATSVLFNNDKMWVGGTADHLIRLNAALADNDSYSPYKFTLFGGYTLSLVSASYKREINQLLFAFHFKAQGLDKQLDFGTYYQRNDMLVGLWYRGIPVFVKSPSHDALTLLLGYKWNDLSFGYSYDITISRLITHTGGAHEISLIYQLSQKPWSRKRAKITPVPCPGF